MTHCYSHQIEDLRYNTEQGQFEALVVLHEGPEDARSYFCTVECARSVGFGTLSKSLVAQAKRYRTYEGNVELAALLKAVHNGIGPSPAY